MTDYTEKKLKILVVEDNLSIIEGLDYLLRKEGFDVTILGNKTQAIQFIKDNIIDLYLLDVQLPDGTGFEICKFVKKYFPNKPVMFISGRAEESNIVYGLDIGADDYIVKPFGNNELVSRIKAVLRRYPQGKSANNNVIHFENLSINLDKAKVYKNQEEIYLTSLEYKILLMFVNNIGKIITRDELLEKVWDIEGNYVNDNTLTVYIKRLREKIADKNDKPLIETVRGIGYILNK